MYQTHQRKEDAILGAAFSSPHTDHRDMNRAAQNSTLSVTNIMHQLLGQSAEPNQCWSSNSRGLRSQPWQLGCCGCYLLTDYNLNLEKPGHLKQTFSNHAWTCLNNWWLTCMKCNSQQQNLRDSWVVIGNISHVQHFILLARCRIKEWEMKNP